MQRIIVKPTHRPVRSAMVDITTQAAPSRQPSRGSMRRAPQRSSRAPMPGSSTPPHRPANRYANEYPVRSTPSSPSIGSMKAATEKDWPGADKNIPAVPIASITQAGCKRPRGPIRSPVAAEWVVRGGSSEDTGGGGSRDWRRKRSTTRRTGQGGSRSGPVLRFASGSVQAPRCRRSPAACGRRGACSAPTSPLAGDAPYVPQRRASDLRAAVL